VSRLRLAAAAPAAARAGLTAAGNGVGGMPRDFGERIAPADLDRLVELLSGR
jgi:hypothetical protein